MWSIADIADAVAEGLRQQARALDAEQAVYGLDSRDELGLHPILQAALRAAGYGGEKIVQISPADYPNVRAANEVLADMLQRIGINLDYVSTDWSSMTQRVIKKDPPEAGGWNIHMLNVPCLSVASPLVNSRLRGTGAEESGWYANPRYEGLRGEWMLTGTMEDRKRVAEALQRECIATVPLVPAGVTLQPAAWRADLEGVLPGVPKFWNVRRRT